MAELISSYIDLVAIKKETDLFLEQIESLKKAKDELSRTKAILNIASNNKDIVAGTNASAKAYDDASKAADAFNKNIAKGEAAQKATAKATKDATTETDKLVGAYDRLKNQFKEADTEAKNLAAEFGVNSEQALKAAESAAALKQQLKEIDALSKTVNTPKVEQSAEQPAEIPFTHNLNEDGSVKTPDFSNATTAVNELNKAEAELTNTATAMGNSNLQAGEDIKTTTASVEQASTALQELNGTIAQNVKVYNDYQAELKAVKAEQKAIEAAIKEAGEASQQDIERKIQLGIRERELKIASAELNQTINAQTKELQAAEGSYDKMNHQLGQMRDAFRQLSEEERNSAFGQELQSRIQITDEAIKQLDANIGNFQRNVGNYKGSFSEPFKLLQVELEVIKQKLNDPALTGKSLEALQKEEALLIKLTESLSKEFPNLTREVRAITNASNQLGAQLGEDSELFLRFAAAAGEASDAQKDLQAHVTFNASDTKYIDSAVEAVNGLAGAYSAAEGAAQLFGDGNEDVQRGMQKLQALIAITTGLQQVQNALQSESAAMQGLQAAKTALLATAMNLQNLATTASVAATQAATVANGEAAVSAEVTTVALEEETVATTAAATATTGLTTAIAVGLLGAFAAIGAALYFAFKALGNWIVGTQKSVEEQGKLLDLIKSQNDALLEQASILAQQTAAQKTFYDTQLSMSQASGANAYKQFAIRKEIAKQEADLAQQQIDLLGANNKEQARLLSTIEKANNARLRASETLTTELTKNANDQDERVIKSAQGIIDINDKIIAANKPLYDAGQKAREDAMAANKESTLLELEETKFSTDERRKLLLETTTLETDLVKSKNSLILNDERSNLAQRLAAIRSNAAAERKVIEAQKNDVLNNPSSTPIDRTIAIRKANEEVIKLNQSEKSEEYKENEDFRRRDLAANKSMVEMKLQAEIDANDKVTDNDQLSLETRLHSLNTSYQDRKAIVDAEYQNQKKLNEGRNVTNAEEELLEKDHEAKLSALAINTSAKVRDITLKDIEAQKAGLESLFTVQEQLYNQAAAFRNVKPATDHADAILALNDQLQKGKISIERYNKDREKLDQAYNVSQLENAVKNDKDLIDIAHKFGKDDFALQKKLADDKVALEDATNAKLKASKQALHEKEKEIAEASFDLLQTIGDAGFTTELNRIQTLIDANDNYYNKEIENIKNSTLSTQEKAERTTILEAEQAAKKSQLEKKQRDEQLKQAKFDRDAQVLKIIGEALYAHFAIVAAFATELNPLAGLAAAVANDILAGIQVAALLAQPLPKFKTGKMNDYEGYAIVGDGGKREPILRENGKVELSPATDTLTWLGSKDKVFSDINTFENYITKRTETNYAPLAVNQQERKQAVVAFKIKADIDVNDKIAHNLNAPLETRLNALTTSFESRKSLLEAEYKKTTEKHGIIELSKKDYEAKLTALTVSSHAKLLDITLQNVKDSELISHVSELKMSNIKHAENVLNLNNSLQENKLSVKDYEKERSKLDTEHSLTTREVFASIKNISTEADQIKTLVQAQDILHSRRIEAIKLSTNDESVKSEMISYWQNRHEANKLELVSKLKEEELKQQSFETVVNLIKSIKSTTAFTLPMFKHGKFTNYEGLAITGDGGKREPIVRENGVVELSPDKPTLTWIGKKDYVFPDVKSFTSTISTRHTDRLISNSTLKTDPNKELIHAYRQSAARFESAIKKIPQPRINFYNNGEFNEWVKVNVRGRR